MTAPPRAPNHAHSCPCSASSWHAAQIGKSATRSGQVRRPGVEGGRRRGEESAQDRQHRGSLGQTGRSRGPTARGPHHSPASAALHVVYLDAGPAPEVIGTVTVNKPLLAGPAGLNRSHGRLLAVDAAHLREGEQRGWEGSSPHEALGAPKKLWHPRAVQLRGLDVDDEAQEVENPVIYLCSMNHTPAMDS